MEKMRKTGTGEEKRRRISSDELKRELEVDE